MRELDGKAINKYGIPGIVLMENAAAGVCEEILRLASADNPCGRSAHRVGAPDVGASRMAARTCAVLFVCGKGNNGGDGFAAARRLYQMMNPYTVRRGEFEFRIGIIVLAEREEIRGDARANLNICEKLKMNIAFVNTGNVSRKMELYLSEADIVVDAIFGTGFRGAAEGVYDTAIRMINLLRYEADNGGSAKAPSFGTAKALPIGTAKALPIGTAKTLPIGTAKTPPFGTAKALPIGTAKTPPFGTAKALPIGKAPGSGVLSVAGALGALGVSDSPGTSGALGVVGVSGTMGVLGVPGTVGATDVVGIVGATGVPGASDVSGVLGSLGILGTLDTLARGRNRYKILSVDVPSGIDASTGIVDGVCVKADVTVTLGLVKTGLVTGKNADYAGEVFCCDIGIPEAAIRDISPDTFMITQETVAGLLKRREKDSHKGDYGRAMIITGSPGMTGAGCLAAEASLRSGAGLVYIAAPGGLSHIYETALREAITLAVGDSSSIRISEAAISDLLFSGTDVVGAGAPSAGVVGAGAPGEDIVGAGAPGEDIVGSDVLSEDVFGAGAPGAGTPRSGVLRRRMDAIALGPGMSTEKDVAGAVASVVRGVDIPLILDADALNIIAEDIEMLDAIKAPTVLTPHLGEMARLMGVSAEVISENRLGAARAFAAKHKVCLVLKGHRTIIALPDGRAFVNVTGNPGMATAGSGDVLTGMITAFAAGGMDVTDASVAAVFLHGLAGDLAAEKLGETSIKAGDIIDFIGQAFKAVSH